MIDLIAPILTLLLQYGYPIILAIMVIGYIGIPVPVNITILAAGAFTADGTLSLTILIPLVIITAIVADVIQYVLGKKFSAFMFRQSLFSDAMASSKMITLEQLLKDWGMWYVFLTRWLLTPLAVPTNLIAGVTQFSFKQFLVMSIIGEILWGLIYLLLGNAFGTNWSMLVEYVDNVPELLVFICIGVLFLYLGVKMWLKNHD